MPQRGRSQTDARARAPSRLTRGTCLLERSRGGARCDELGVETLRGRELGLRIGGLPELAQQESEVEMCSCVVRIDRDDLAVECDRLCGGARARADDREVEEGAFHLRVLVERKTVERLGGGDPVLPLRDLAEVVVGELVLWVFRKRGEVGGDGLVELPGGVRREAAVQGVGGGLVRRAARGGATAGGRECDKQQCPCENATLHSASDVNGGSSDHLGLLGESLEVRASPSDCDESETLCRSFSHGRRLLRSCRSRRWPRRAIGASPGDRTAITPYRSPLRSRRASSEGEEGNAQGHDRLRVRARTHAGASGSCSRERFGWTDGHPVLQERRLAAARDDSPEKRGRGT